MTILHLHKELLRRRDLPRHLSESDYDVASAIGWLMSRSLAVSIACALIAFVVVLACIA